MPKSPKDDYPHRAFLDEFARGARNAAALKAALELEIFSRIAEGQRSLPALLRATGLDERGARMLLDALANIGLLIKSPYEYLLTPTAETFLVKGKPTYYGDAWLAQLMWDARSQLSRAVRSGKPGIPASVDGGARALALRASPTWVEWHAILQEFAGIWENLGVSAIEGEGLRALALGVEAGLRLLPLAQRAVSAQVTVVDSAPALALLKPIVDALGLREQVHSVEGDWLTIQPEREAFDFALVDSITAVCSLEQNVGILHRTYEALRMGGRIVLRALTVDDERRGPSWVPLLGLDLLISTMDGDIYTTTEYRGMLEAAGFFELTAIAEQNGFLTARRIPPPPLLPPAPTVAPDFIPPSQTFT